MVYMYPTSFSWIWQLSCFWNFDCLLSKKQFWPRSGLKKSLECAWKQKTGFETKHAEQSRLWRCLWLPTCSYWDFNLFVDHFIDISLDRLGIYEFGMVSSVAGLFHLGLLRGGSLPLCNLFVFWGERHLRYFVVPVLLPPRSPRMHGLCMLPLVRSWERIGVGGQKGWQRDLSLHRWKCLKTSDILVVVPSSIRTESCCHQSLHLPPSFI